MSFFKKSVSALILFSLPSSVYARDLNSIPEYLMAKALVTNYVHFGYYSFPAVRETKLSEREAPVVSCFYEAIRKSEIEVSRNDLDSIYDEIKYLYRTINNIIDDCFEYFRHEPLNSIINNMNMDSLSDAGLNLFKNLCNSIYENLVVEVLNFDKAIFKSLMQTSPDIWLSYMCDKCRSEDDNDNYYDKIKQIFDYQYNYLNDNPNYLTEQ